MYLSSNNIYPLSSQARNKPVPGSNYLNPNGMLLFFYYTNSYRLIWKFLAIKKSTTVLPQWEDGILRQQS